MKVSSSSAMELSKMGPAMRSQLLRLRLVRRIAFCAPSASLSATSNAFVMSSAAGTVRLTSPMRSASLPSMKSQVSR